MSRRRERRTYSLALETGPKLIAIAEEIRREMVSLPVHPGIVIDVLVRDASKETVMEAMGVRKRLPEAAHA